MMPSRKTVLVAYSAADGREAARYERGDFYRAENADDMRRLAEWSAAEQAGGRHVAVIPFEEAKAPMFLRGRQLLELPVDYRYSSQPRDALMIFLRRCVRILEMVVSFLGGRGFRAAHKAALQTDDVLNDVGADALSDPRFKAEIAKQIKPATPSPAYMSKLALAPDLPSGSPTKRQSKRP